MVVPAPPVQFARRGALGMREPSVTIGDSTIVRRSLDDPDVRLMLAVRNGDGSAFEQLVVRYQHRLLAVIGHLTGSRDQAEDLAQEVFLRVFRARHTYTPDAKFTTWLFTIANRVVLNARRARSRRREVTLAPSNSDTGSQQPLANLALAASGLAPARQLDKMELREVVRAALEMLNERQRLAVLLNKFEGLPYAEIAQVMELSPEAVKSLLSRARVQLRLALEPYLAGGPEPPPHGDHAAPA